MHLIDQLFHIGQRAEHRIDVIVIGDVVAEVFLRRLVSWTDPHNVDTKSLEVVQLRDDPLNVAMAIAGRVLERFRPYLVADLQETDWSQGEYKLRALGGLLPLICVPHP